MGNKGVKLYPNYFGSTSPGSPQQRLVSSSPKSKGGDPMVSPKNPLSAKGKAAPKPKNGKAKQPSVCVDDSDTPLSLKCYHIGYVHSTAISCGEAAAALKGPIKPPYHVQKAKAKKAAALGNHGGADFTAESLKAAANKLEAYSVSAQDVIDFYGPKKATGLKLPKSLPWGVDWRAGFPASETTLFGLSDMEAEYAGCCLPVAGGKDKTKPVRWVYKT